MRAYAQGYAQGGQYNTIVESRVPLIWYQSHALNLGPSANLGKVIEKEKNKINKANGNSWIRTEERDADWVTT